MITFLNNHISEIILGISGLGAWLFERNKRKEDLKSIQTQNLQSVLDFYQDAIKDLRINYDATLNEMKRNNEEKFQTLEQDIKSLRDNVNLWKGKYRKLKEEFDDYRSKHEK